MKAILLILTCAALTAVSLPIAAAPSVVLSGVSLNYVENDGPRAVDAALILTDAGSSNITGATVQITGNYHSEQDVLHFVDTTNITGTFATNTGMLTLTGNTTVSNYQAALRTVTYRNTSENPSTGISVRTVTWTVTDDLPSSGFGTNTMTVRPINDAPVITSVDSFTLNYAPTFAFQQPLGLSFVDVDASGDPNIDFEITITATPPKGPFSSLGSLAGFQVDVPGAVITANSVKFTASPAQATTYCANLMFTANKLPDPATVAQQPTFVITVTVNDNGFSGLAAPPSTAPSNPQTTVKQIVGTILLTSPNEVDLTLRTNVVQATSANSPAGQGATNAIDNSAATKYLNLDKLNTGLTITVSSDSAMRGLTLISAEDAPERNPTSYILAGSQNGVNFTTISSNTVPPFVTTNSIQSFSFPNATGYPFYRLTFPTVADAVAANSMQIAEVELLTHPELTSSNDVISVTLPTGAFDIRGVTRLIDRQLGLTNKFEIAPIAGAATVVNLAPAVGASVLSGFELIGGADDVSFPERRPSSFGIAGSVDGTNFTQLGVTIIPAPPSANSQIQEFSIFGYTNTYTHYRLTFGAPVSGDRLQVGEVRLFGEVNNSLGVFTAANQVTMQWLAVAGLNLEQNTNLFGGSWTAVTNVPTLNNGTNAVSLSLNANASFFRLHKL